ncbi:MAG TPA: type VI secretion system contractile sheath large subunit [Rhodothermales bacterium]|nr:type VI secretion system contractile sheath large subunit [Rhodothermales bacterium]
MSESAARRVGLFISSDPDETRIHPQPEGLEARARVELPFRLLLVSDLLPQSAPEEWDGASRLVTIDRNSFGPFMQQARPRLSLVVPNRLSEAPRSLDLDLEFPSLQAFQPSELASQIPGLAQLVAVRAAVDELRRGTLDFDSLRTRLSGLGADTAWIDQIMTVLRAVPPSSASPLAAASSPGQAGNPPDALDRLMGLVELGDDGPAPHSETPRRRGGAGIFDVLMGAVTGGSPKGPRVEQPAAEALIADLDSSIGDQLQAVYEHPAFRSLESAWRGLKFLVDRLDFRRGVQLDVLAASKEAAGAAVYHQVLIPEHDGQSGRAPLSAVVLEHAFSKSQPDVDLLLDLAETGASLQVPVIAGAAPDFFGVERWEGLAHIDALQQHVSGPEYIPWQGLRGSEYANNLAIALPSVVLRPPYTFGSSGASATFLREQEPLWGTAALAVAVVAADSFVRTGWPTHLYGSATAQIEDLPTWSSRRGQIPLGTILPESQQADLAALGFTVLGCKPDRDVAYVTHAPTVRYVDAYESASSRGEAVSHASLPCQLFVSRAAQFMLAFQSEASAGVPRQNLQSDLSTRLRALLDVPGAGEDDSVVVERHEGASNEARDVFTVRIRPPRSVLDDSVSLVMGFQVPSSHYPGATE